MTETVQALAPIARLMVNVRVQVNALVTATASSRAIVRERLNVIVQANVSAPGSAAILPRSAWVAAPAVAARYRYSGSGVVIVQVRA
ncbi:MAG: hypothetical protein ACOC9B_01525 [Chloroflexota bacterium]